MQKLPKGIEKELRKYLSDLESRLEFERETLHQVTPNYPEGHKLTNEEVAAYRQIREPIVNTMLAYGNAISKLYEHFPQLKLK